MRRCSVSAIATWVLVCGSQVDDLGQQTGDPVLVPALGVPDPLGAEAVELEVQGHLVGQGPEHASLGGKQRAGGAAYGPHAR